MKRLSPGQRLFKWIAWLLAFASLSLCACAEPSSAADTATAGGSEQTHFETVTPTQTATVGKTADMLHLPTAAGTTVYEGNGVTIDASFTGEGYVMVAAAGIGAKLKAGVSIDSNTYYYDMPDDGSYQTLPLHGGNGTYFVRVLENVGDDMYAVVYGTELTVSIADPLSPYLYANQYVWFDGATKAVEQAVLLTSGMDSEQEIAETLYRFVADTISYDTVKAATVETGYLPDADETLATKKGICFDYAVLLAVMLRSRGIATQVRIGTVSPENIYHAWNAVYLDGEWVWMDPTLDGTGHTEQDYQTDKTY